MLNENCLIIAGEKSGEEHAMSFLPGLIQHLDGLKLFGVGGDEMKSLGVELLYHLKDFSSWGFSEVIQKIPFYFKALNIIVDEVERRNCKFAILVDFQDFNLRLAKRLSERGVKVLYYVAPQAWAWKAWRTKKLEKYVHTLFTIIPFEEKWFSDRGVSRVCSVPHPLWFHFHKNIEELNQSEMTRLISERPKVLLLPGSRNFEVKNLLSDFINAVDLLDSNCELGIVTSPSVKKELYEPYEKYFSKIFKHDEISKALSWGEVSIAASGTVTLTCALFSMPTVVCYKTSLLNEYIFSTFLNYKWFISLANIVHQKEVFPELLQNEVSPHNIAKRIDKWVKNPLKYSELRKELSSTLELIAGGKENISEMMAKIIGGKSS